MNRKNQDRLSSLRESANESARNFRTVYVSYLIVALYIFSIVLHREEELLFRNGDIQIAVINLSVPIASVFIISPLVLLVLHINLLVQAVLLSRKVHMYAKVICSPQKIEMLDLLFPAPLVHIVTGEYIDQKDIDYRKTIQVLLQGIVVLSIVILPLTILIFTGKEFLIYQSKYHWIFIWQSIIMVIDVVFLWVLWPKIIAPNEKCTQMIRMTIAMSAVIYIIFGILNILDIADGEAISIHSTLNKYKLYKYKQYKLENRELIQEKPQPEILSTYLDICRGKRCDETVIDPGSPVWCKYARPLELKGRVFRDAELDSAILCAVNFEDTIFNYADLSKAKLNGAKFINAELHDTLLVEADLHGAYLTEAKFHGADLTGAELHGADLTGAELHGADLTGAELHGADLRNVDLRGAILRKVKFYGADLTNADLRGSDLRGAKFYGAVLVRANFEHADLRIIDFSEPDFELYMLLKKTINDMNILNKIQDRIANAKNHRISIDPLSTIRRYYSIDDSHDFPHFVSYSGEKSIGDRYREKLAIYLVDDLVCKDKLNDYVAKGIARRALADDLLGPQLAENLLKAKCPAVANMLPEQLRADLEKITDG